jgi:hypothetical protein
MARGRRCLTFACCILALAFLYSAALVLHRALTTTPLLRLPNVLLPSQEFDLDSIIKAEAETVLAPLVSAAGADAALATLRSAGVSAGKRRLPRATSAAAQAAAARLLAAVTEAGDADDEDDDDVDMDDDDEDDDDDDEEDDDEDDDDDDDEEDDEGEEDGGDEDGGDVDMEGEGAKAGAAAGGAGRRPATKVVAKKHVTFAGPAGKVGIKAAKAVAVAGSKSSGGSGVAAAGGAGGKKKGGAAAGGAKGDAYDFDEYF